MDIKKLKYDLSMQYMMIDVLQNYPKLSHDAFFDLRTYMLDKFEACYRHFSTLDDSNWEVFKELDKDKK